jgi:hypothetical protein
MLGVERWRRISLHLGKASQRGQTFLDGFVCCDDRSIARLAFGK